MRGEEIGEVYREATGKVIVADPCRTKLACLVGQRPVSRSFSSATATIPCSISATAGEAMQKNLWRPSRIAEIKPASVILARWVLAV